MMVVNHNSISRLTTCIALTALLIFSSSVDAQSSYQSVCRDTQPKMVKINGGGGVRGWEAYQSGFCISADGLILTAWSYVLDVDSVKVTLDDGQKFDAKLVGYDPKIEIAVLKIEADGLPHFRLDAAVPAKLGNRILAFSNLYGVAAGDEPYSVQAGVVGAITNLSSRRGAFDSAYRGEVYLLDAITNNPGATGGAICDRKGRLVGMIGKELRDKQLGTWLNFALPISSIVDSVQEIRSGKMVVESKPTGRKPSEPMTLDLLGLVLVPDVVDRTPPFVDRIVLNSAADSAGLMPDDLIISVNGNLCTSIQAFAELLEFIDRDSTVELMIRRGKQFESVEVRLGQ